MVSQLLFSPQVKRRVIISNKLVYAGKLQITKDLIKLKNIRRILKLHRIITQRSVQPPK